MFVAALLGDPEILILDEPTAGLDPEERIKIRNYVSELSGERIVILATHVVSDIECIASKILLLYQGKLLAENTPGGLIDTVTDKVYEKICTHEGISEGKCFAGSGRNPLPHCTGRVSGGIYTGRGNTGPGRCVFILAEEIGEIICRDFQVVIRTVQVVWKKSC